MSERPDEPDHGIDVDAAFADIVAHYGDVPDLTEGVDDSVTESLDHRAGDGADHGADHGADQDAADSAAPPAAAQNPPADGPAVDTPPAAAQQPPSVREPGWGDSLDTPASWDDEGHFVPPPPPPLPAVEPRRRAAWAALFGAPLVMLLVIVAGVGVPGWVVVGLALAFIGGFVYLVATMGSPGGPSWPDDGAVV